MSELTLDILSSGVGETAAGFRSITKLQPLDGPGGKIFPATYANGVYAVEKRRLVYGSGEEKEEREVERPGMEMAVDSRDSRSAADNTACSDLDKAKPHLGNCYSGCFASLPKEESR